MSPSIAKNLGLRLLYAVLSLLFISFITFVADEISPGDQATILAGEKATPEAVIRLREQLGLNRPWGVRYVEYLGGLSRGNLGNSFHGTREPIVDIVKRTLPMTITVATCAILLAAIVGILLGTIAAVTQNRFGDRTILIVSTLGVTIPNFVLAPVFVKIFAVNMDILPSGWSNQLAGPVWMYLLMPVVILAARPMAQITRLCRASMIETLQQEFIKLARAKGVPPLRLTLRHALRNAILPVVTAIGTNFGFLLTGSFIIETAFRLPGIGATAIEAIKKGDTPVIQATVLIAGSLFVLINLLVDLIQPTLDPRIREAQV
ncbi:MAG: ABC transporter permease [Fimbriimonadaceae bacterium]|nr:ABC transporter permease [Fimbriimonadaceae bacterium]